MINRKDISEVCDTEAESDLIFIMGIMQRSGTNYLNNLLLLHPDCEYPGFVWEDYLLAPAEYLDKYAKSVYNNWIPDWKTKLEETVGSNPLLRCLGEGLGLFFKKQFDGRRQLSGTKTQEETSGYPTKLVTATPSIKGIKYFFDLFPSACLLIIIRDGRSVIESGVKTFDWDYEYAMRRWRDAAQSILQFVQTAQGKRYLVVKYEDLCTDTNQEMTRILSFLGLDIKRYDFSAASNLTVVGSCEVRNSEGNIHWNPREKKSDFNPVNRWQYWGRPLHERFNWLVGESMKRSGYAILQYESYRTLWRLWNIVIDVLFNLEVWLLQRSLFLHNILKRLRKALSR